MTYQEAIYFINSYSKSGEPVNNLQRFSTLMAQLGNIHKKMRIVHVAGTNGKGSVCEYISCVLKEKGMRVGKFTSPYIIEMEERIQINGKNISKEALALLCGEVSKAVEACENKGFSQFEIITAIGFLYFYKEQVDIVVLEAGIGGLLDCTNIVNSEISVITTIHYDHTQILGDTLAKIAAHKAGIIKSEGKVVISPKQPIEALQAITRIAETQDALVVIPDLSRLQIIHKDTSDTFFNYKGDNYQTQMAGDHQLFNAMTAIEVCKLLGIEYASIYGGIEKAKLMARMEIVQRENPVFIVDGGHNKSGIFAAKALLLQDNHRKIGIVGMLNNKDYNGVLQDLLPIFEQVVFVDDFAENAVKYDELKRIAGKYNVPCCYGTSADAAKVKAIQLAGNDGLVLCIGSLYLAGEVRKLFPLN